MVMGAGITDDKDKAVKMLTEVIENGKALEKLAQLVKNQGGDEKAVYDTTLLPQSTIIHEVKAETDGYVSTIHCEQVGVSAMVLGGGRETKESVIDLAVGIVLSKKVGDIVKTGDTIATFYANDPIKLQNALKRFEGAYEYSTEITTPKKLIRTVIN